jgi:hypothetical protein
VHETLSGKIINQAQFVVTTAALKFSRYCVLFSKTLAVNAPGILAIPRQNAQI